MNISPLLILFLLYLFIGVLGKNKKTNQNRNQRPGQNPQKPAAPAARTAPARQPSAEKPKKTPAAVNPASAPEVSYTAHRGADGTLHPTERHQHPTAAPTLLTMEGEGVEGYDPCHDYMLDDPVLPVCEDLDTDARTEAASPPLSFTRDSMVSAVVMSEILNRRSNRPGTAFRH